MSKLTKEELKQKFQTGDKPTEKDFSDLIDNLSSPLVEGDEPSSAVLEGEYQGVKNRALSKTAMAVGAGTMAGLKGWYYSKIDFTSNQITLSEVQPRLSFGNLVGGKWSLGTPDINVGDKISIVNDAKYSYCGEVKSISGGVITLKEALPFTSLSTSILVTNIDDWSIFLPDRPEAGIIDFGGGAFSEGGQSKASNICAHAEGLETHAYGQYAHAEGRGTRASYAAHAEGRDTVASGSRSHAEGGNSVAFGNYSHAEGKGENTLVYLSGNKEDLIEVWKKSTKNHHIAAANQSHVEGENCLSAGWSSHAEGRKTAVVGNYSHAEGVETYVSGEGAHAEGNKGMAIGKNSHIEGTGDKDFTSSGTTLEEWETNQNFHAAIGNQSHAEGGNNIAIGNQSHVEGWKTCAKGNHSHAEGTQTKALNADEHACGRYNNSVESTDNAKATAFSVGVGTSKTSRKNGLEVKKNGDVYILGINQSLQAYLEELESRISALE